MTLIASVRPGLCACARASYPVTLALGAPRETVMRVAIRERKMGEILAPIELIYMFWLMMTVMFNFRVFMISLVVQFILIGLFAIVDLVIERPERKLLAQRY